MLLLVAILLAGPTAAWRPTVCGLSGQASCVVTPPTPCPVNPLFANTPREGERFNCSIVDLRVAVSADRESLLGSSPEFGLLVRFFVPSSVAASMPLLLTFHGTGR